MVLINDFHLGKIVTLRNQGLTFRRLEDLTSIPRSTIHRCLNKYNKNGSIVRKKGSGRPNVLNNDDIDCIKAIHNENPTISAPKLNIFFKEKQNKKVSVETIRRCLNSLGLYAYSPYRKPLLSTKNILRRNELCHKWLFMPDTYWENIIFSDECKFNLYNSDGITHVWRGPKKGLDSKYVEHTVKFNKASLMVWGCFSARGVGNLVFIDGIMDRFKYLNILTNNLKQSAASMDLNNYVFQQDNDPKHTSKIISQYLEENEIETLPFPSQSPDLNPIEHIWAYMKKEIKGKNFDNKDQLKDELVRLWYSLPQVFINNLIKSMPKRVRDVVKANGKHTKY